MSLILEKAKKEFFHMVKSFPADPYLLCDHLPEVERWARHLLKKYPKANKEVVLLGVWLHDLGHYPAHSAVDHAARGEQRARKFLKKNHYPKAKMEKVLHCVRAHRCKDIMPESVEAKIVSFSDSASHITDTVYLKMARDNKFYGNKYDVVGKMNRDYRDFALFPQIQKQLTPLYKAWKNLIHVYKKFDLD